MLHNEVFSTSLGYTSIACWLGAQLPQIIVNWRRQSVDGLALPFLANWLLGDTTNLVGCLLTDQLPFQTYLATYFVLIDICLVSQYLHYDAPRHAKALSVATSPSAHQSRTSLISHSPETHSVSRARVARSRSGSHSVDPLLRVAAGNVALHSSERDSRYEASMAAEVDGHGSQRWRSRGRRSDSSLMCLPESVVDDSHERHRVGRRHISLERDPEEAAGDAETESAPSLMINSFHSEGGGRARGRGKHVSWTQENPSRDGGAGQGQSSDDIEPLNTSPSRVRGRQLARPYGFDSPIVTEALLSETDSPRARRGSTASAVSAAASRRSASIVFLALFGLFSFSSHLRVRRSAGLEGRVLNMPPRGVVFIPDDMSRSTPLAHATPLSFVTTSDSVVQVNDIFEFPSSGNEDTQRLIGRVSAWTCTTLYITSRLPQIWKNFVRKSVEGLSMYLFIFAFLGNFFYVLSILTSPKMDLAAPLARQFIRDSIPYLLGSGGTLLFDITIVLQSFVYDPSRRGLRSRMRRKSLVGASEEERRVLIAADRSVEDAC